MTRYAMNVRDIVPWWVPYSAIAFIILVCGSILISTAIALDPWGLFVAPLALYGIWFTHWFFKGMSNPARNYIELTGDRLAIHRWLPTWFGHQRAAFRLREIARIDTDTSHSGMTFSYFPWTGAMRRRHIDIHFKGAQFVGWRSGHQVPWLRVLHIDVQNSEEFLKQLTAYLNDSRT